LANDIAILNSGKIPNTVSELLQQVLSKEQQWCEGTQLTINPQNIMLFPFTSKREFRGLDEPNLS